MNKNASSLEKINNIDKPLVNLTDKKGVQHSCVKSKII